MKCFLKKALLFFILVVFFLFIGCSVLDYLFGDITITEPMNGTLVGTSSVTIYVESTFNYIDYISVEVNGNEVYYTTEGDFRYTVLLIPGWNTIEVICYAYQNEKDTMSSFAGSDSIEVYYDNEDPEISIDSPANWSIQTTSDVTISGTVTDNYGLPATLEYLEDGVYKILTITFLIDNRDGTWALNLTGLSNSTHSYVFRVEDLAGRAVMSSVTFTVDDS